jgi:hypothetical protein
MDRPESCKLNYDIPECVAAGWVPRKSAGFGIAMLCVLTFRYHVSTDIGIRRPPELTRRRKVASIPLRGPRRQA